MNFSRGDLAYYPSHGLARIVAIRREKLEESQQTFYVLELLDRSCIIKIPAHRIKDLGLREILNKNQVRRIFQILRTKPSFQRGSWSKRFRDYAEKLRRGTPFEIAEVLRDLMVIKERTGKELSFAERRLLEAAKQTLIKELAFAAEEDEKTIATKVQEAITSLLNSGNRPRT